MASITVTHFSDPGCPWAYSASPAFAVLRWRYGEQLSWRLVTIGLADDARRYVDAGYTPARSAIGYMRYRRYGMPLLAQPRERIPATGPACRAIVATRMLFPGREHEVHRALQFGWFTTSLVLDREPDMRTALARVRELDVDALLAALDDERVLVAYEADKREARSAAGSPTELQGKARQTDGPVRYSAPSLLFAASDGRRLEAGGFQRVEAYDVLVVNLDPALARREPPQDPTQALREFPAGLVTQEVAAIMAPNNQEPDRAAAEQALIQLSGEGSVRRTELAGDALWQLA